MAGNEDIKYCVTAIIDLLGFSSHLKLGHHDLRTNIGKQAIDRLQILEKAVAMFEAEMQHSKSEYPENLKYIRINDALILTIDLPTFLTPPIGKAMSTGPSTMELGEYFSENELESEEIFLEAYTKKVLNSTESLSSFLGLIARLHIYINSRENDNFFPGAKTVISTGYRKPFFNLSNKEDYFSANFSFTNAYLAQEKLKNSKLYVDNYILHLLAANPFVKNLIRFAHFTRSEPIFNPFEDYEDPFYLPTSYIKTEYVCVNILSRDFNFREMNPNPLVYLQILRRLHPYLIGEISPKSDSKIILGVFNAIKNGPVFDHEKHSIKKGFIIYHSSGIESDIRIIPEIIESGKSEILESKKVFSNSRVSLSDNSISDERV